MVEAKTWNRQGEGKELEETHGIASVLVEETGRGLHVLYSKEMLAKLEAAQERRWGATAARVVHVPRVVGKGSGAVRPGKDEY